MAIHEQVYKKSVALSRAPSLPILLCRLHRGNLPANHANIYETIFVLVRDTVPHNEIGLLHFLRHDIFDAESTIDEPSSLTDSRVAAV